MSATLAVWEGETPVSDKAAAQIFQELYALPDQPPTPRIEAFVQALLARYPDIDDDNEEETPWSDGPLMNDASGPLFCFGMTYGDEDLFTDAFEFIAETAEAHGLIMYDPDQGTLVVPRPVKPKRRWFRR
jgi:hypothetical protein